MIRIQCLNLHFCCFFALSVIHCMLKLNCTAAFSCSLRKHERRSTVYTAGNLITLHTWFLASIIDSLDTPHIVLVLVGDYGLLTFMAYNLIMVTVECQ